MRQTNLFSKTRFDAPKDEVAKNAELLIRGGFIHKEMAGVYSLLPLGLRVIEKITKIVREEMEALGGQEISMTALQGKEIWEKTDRFDDKKVDNWFKTALKNGTELGLAFTHEEPITELMKDHVKSYRDLPFSVFQFQTKFRNETRAKSGILRTREFLMKDLYSFSKDEEEHKAFYEKSKVAYTNIFKRAGVGDKTFLTVASGGSFSTEFSHEYQTETEAGEDIIYYDKEKNIAINKEVLNDETLKSLGVNKSKLEEKKSIEVGNIYSLGDFYSKPLGLVYSDEKGEKKPVIMGSYGIGIPRLMGAIAEVYGSDSGIVWPKEVAPFSVHIILATLENKEIVEFAEKLYKDLKDKGVEVLLDDRDVRAGEKFNDADLIGIPKRIVLGQKNFENGEIEVIDRETRETKLLKKENFLADFLK